jgi:hypothetical protein
MISTTVQLNATLITSVLQTISFIIHTLGEMTGQQGTQEQIIKCGLLTLDIYFQLKISWELFCLCQGKWEIVLDGSTEMSQSQSLPNHGIRIILRSTAVHNFR